MSVLLPEGAETAEVVVRPALITLGALTAYAVAYGITSALHGFVKGVGGIVGWIAGHTGRVGQLVLSPVNEATQWLTNELGTAVTYYDTQVGLAWHAWSTLVNHAANWMVAQAIADYTIARSLASRIERRTVTITRDYSKAIRRGLAVAEGAAVAGDLALARRIERAWNGVIAARIHAAERMVIAELDGLRDWTIPRVKSAERAIDVTIPGEIANLRERVKAAENEAARLFRLVKAHPLGLASTAFAGAVAVALGRLGAGWTRCSNWQRLGRGVCRSPASVIDGLLAGLLMVIGTVSLVELATELEKLIGAAEGEIRHFWQADVAGSARNPGLGDAH